MNSSCPSHCRALSAAVSLLILVGMHPSGVLLGQTSGSHGPRTNAWDINLTVDNETRLRGLTRFGSLGEDISMDGFRVDVMQSSVQRMHEVVTPGQTHTTTVMVPTYSPSYNHWEEKVGYYQDVEVMVSPEQQPYSTYTEVVDVEAIPGYFGPPYQTDLVLTPGSDAYDEMVPNGQVDEAGNPLYDIVHHDAVPTVYQTFQDWIPPVPAVTHVVQVDYPYQPAVYETRSEFVVTDVIPHDDYVGDRQTGEHEEVQTIQDPDIITTEAYTDYSTPIARFTGTRPGLTWAWRNWQDTNGSSMQDLMTLSEGGMLFPTPGDAGATASLSYNKFQQSWAGMQIDQAGHQGYRSFGSTMEKDKVSVWNGSGNYQAGTTAPVLSNQDKVEIAADGLTVASQSQTSSNAAQSQTTHIKSSFASFAGNVSVKGVMRVMPAGDIDMGSYTQGPQP